MPQNWENGSAARDYAADTSPSVFAPIDYAARLQNAGARRRRSESGVSYQPGQAYGAPSAPPMAAPDFDRPAYLQQPLDAAPAQGEADAPYAPGYDYAGDFEPPAQEWQPYSAAPAQGEVGAPYSAALFEHQPTAVMPCGWEDGFFDQPSAPEPSPQPPSAQEAPLSGEPVRRRARADAFLRDPFTPAQPRQEEGGRAHKPAPAARRRPSIRLDRLAALLLAGILLTICAVVGGRLIIQLARNEREVEAFRQEYLEKTGMEVYAGAQKVELPPAGQTFAPVHTPTPTAAQPTPTPTPIIPVYGALGLTGQTQAQTQAGETASPQPRTRLTAYPKNPMRNITESLREMVAQNSDVVGRLVIDGVLDEMVMQRNNTYYLNHNSIGAASEAGAVFADESCSLRTPPENLLLRGQSDVEGKTFAPLWQFISGGSDFAASNMTARLTTLYEEETYVLFAVIQASRDPSSPQYFNFASHPTFTTDQAMLRYVESARAHSVYPFNVDVAADDRLLTLSTLGAGENTLVLIYRMARDNENLGV